MFELPEAQNIGAVIKVIGVGGGGGNAVEYMLNEGVSEIEFVCANTDLQALRNSRAKTLLQLGEELTKGLGAGADPEIGRQAAEENRGLIRDILSGTDMIFITAGMGGGTGTGAAPIFAEVAKELGILTVAVVTKPFAFEGKKRMLIAEEGIRKLAANVDSLITIPNNKLLPVLGKNTGLLQAFRATNNVLMGAVQGISELITRPGLINVDFADVRTVMSEMGMAMMGTASARGEGRAKSAAESAILSPLLEDIDLSGAKGILVNVTSGPDISIGEFEEVGEVIRSFTSEDAVVVVGTVIDQDLIDDLRVTVVVTGLGRDQHTFKASPKTDLVKGLEVPESVGDSAAVTMNPSDTGYREFESPTILRNLSSDREPHRGFTADSESVGKLDEEYLEIPAFLRREG